MITDFDILIRNGKVVDGTGCPWYRSDIGIKGDRIVAMGSLKDTKSKLIIDASSKFVTPGFIESHSHSDATIAENPFAYSSLRQGVTTEVVGLCGASSIPMNETGKKFGAGGFGNFKNIKTLFGSTGEIFEKLEENGISENVVWFVGHNTLRKLVGALGEECTTDQLAEMKQILRTSLEAGAVGLSTGLEFFPGSLAPTSEISELLNVVAEFDGVYASHTRNRDEHILEASDEFIQLIRKHNLRGMFSHLNVRYNTGAPDGAWETVIGMIESARKDGFTIQTDMGYIEKGIGNVAAILPQWVREGGWKETQNRLRDPDVRKKLRTDCDRYWRFIHRGEWDRLAIQSNPAHPEINGLSLPEIAKLWKKDEWDCLFDIFADAGESLDSVVGLGKTFTEEHIIETLTHPLYSYIIDGYTTNVGTVLAEQTRFPLHYSGMVRLFTVLVREKGVFTLEEAVRKVTTMPAGFYHIFDRGLLRPGCFADINIFDLNNLKENATYQEPAQYSEGFDYVIVNGTPVIVEDKHTLATPGKNIRFNVPVE